MGRTSANERFWKYVAPMPDDRGCWEWTGAIKPNGYGVIGVWKSDGKMRNGHAHRVAYELLREPIPAGLTIDHLCKNRSCVNPAHLEVVTLRVNVQRGSGGIAHRMRRQKVRTCPRGHEYDRIVEVRNEHRRKRVCTTCMRAASRRSYERKVGLSR